MTDGEFGREPDDDGERQARRLYALVLGWLVVVIVLLLVFERLFQ